MPGRPTNVQRRATEIRRALGGDIRRIREDAGLTAIDLAAAAGVGRTHLWGIEAGRSEASSRVLARIADALGGTVSIRVYPGTGPRIRDHIQAAIAEALLQVLDAHWKRFPEVPVYRPVRGVIDLVLHDDGRALMVAAEIQSQLRRLEQIVRWSHQKRDALPSADVWRFAAEPATSGLLVVRNTHANRAIVADHGELLRTSFPGRAREAMASLTGTAPWPGSAIVWASLERGRATLLDGPPRGVSVGR